MDYSNVETTRARAGGGGVKVTLAAGVAQGNGGTSLPCIGCHVQAASANTEVVKMNIGAAASANLGVELGLNFNGTTEGAGCQPLFVPVSDVSNLYFFSSDADAVVDIIYYRG